MKINTTLGEMDESDLVKHEGGFENDNELTTTVEYCLAGCRGIAHVLNRPDNDSCFCNQHIHRSVSVTIKKPLITESIAASLG